MKDPELKNQYLNSFTENYKSDLENKWGHGLSHSAQSIQKTYHENNKHVPGNSKIKSSNQVDHQQMEERARATGLTSNNFIDYSAKKQTEDMIANSSQTVAQNQQTINKEGEALQHKVANEKANERHGSLVSDMWNNVDTKERQ